ncbi:glycosyltransferase [Candidatus Pelagibacter sp.]|nr:glycosyltransferase [Candidatus Pelagibacter sp.]
MKSKQIFFSIITPVLNNPEIENVFNCLKKQSYKNFEHIVIDGGSKKKIQKIIKKNKKNISKLIIEKDNGIYDAINKGIKLSKGKVVGILNSDDIYYPGTLKLVYNYFSKKNIDYMFGSVLKNRLMHGFQPDKIWYKFNIYPSHSCGFFVKRSVHKTLGLYDTRFKYSSDRDFIYRLIKNNFKGISSKKYEIFGKFNPHGISSKLNYFRTLFEEFNIRLKNQNLLIVLIIFFITLINKLYNLLLKK